MAAVARRENLFVVDGKLVFASVQKQAVNFFRVSENGQMPAKTEAVVFVQKVVCEDFFEISPNQICVAKSPEIVGFQVILKNEAIRAPIIAQFVGIVQGNFEIEQGLDFFAQTFKCRVMHVNVGWKRERRFVVREKKPIDVGIFRATFQIQFEIIVETPEVRDDERNFVFHSKSF